MTTRLPRRARISLATVAVTTALTAALGGCGTDGSATDSSAASASMSATSSAGAATDTVSPSTSATPGLTTYTVYDIGTTPQGARLYGEQHPLGGPHNLPGAVMALSNTPGDPDYRTLWPTGAFSTASVGDGVIDVVLADQTLTALPSGMTPAQAKLALQQVVYTVQAAAQQQLPVRFLVGGSPASTVLGVPTTGPVAAGDELATLALVNVLSPTQGEPVSGHLSVSGVGSAYEGTIGWQVLDSSGHQVLKGSAQTRGDYTSLTPWSTTVDVSTLPAGDYTFVASSGDAGEGAGPTKDTKDFTVS